MPCIVYENKRFRASTLAMIEAARKIITEYAEDGFDLTLRQLYYQFVARALIANKQSEYKRLGSIVNGARLAGLLDWTHITDRTRSLRKNPHWNNPAAILEACADSYRVDLWADQPVYVEAWIEKDALIGVLESACSKLDVPYFSCRGYSSQSELWRAAMRLVKHANDGKRTVVLHLGDHDPSGIDMTRDVQDRLNLFMSKHVMGRAEVRRLALNMDQVQKFNPPPNPAKMTDSRANDYVSRFGDSSWELDALDPKTIAGLIDDAVANVRNDDIWAESVKRQEDGRERLQELASYEREEEDQ